MSSADSTMLQLSISLCSACLQPGALSPRHEPLGSQLICTACAKRLACVLCAASPLHAKMCTINGRHSVCVPCGDSLDTASTHQSDMAPCHACKAKIVVFAVAHKRRANMCASCLLARACVRGAAATDVLDIMAGL